MRVAAQVSVVLPTRGDSPDFLAALGSALVGSIAVEVLVAHDRRPGRPPLPASPLLADPRVRVIESPRPGPAAARNAALAAAQGRWAAFLDDDDLWLPQHLPQMIETLAQFPQALGAAGDAFIVPPGASTPPLTCDALSRWPRFLPHRTGGPIGFAELLLTNVILTPTVVLALDRIDGRPAFDEALPVMEDHDLWLRLARHGLIVFDPSPTVIVRRRAGSASGDWRRMAESALIVLDRALADCPPDQAPARRQQRRRRAALHHDLAYACLLDDDPAAARRALATALPAQPLRVKNYAYWVMSWLPASFRRAIFAARCAQPADGP